MIMSGRSVWHLPRRGIRNEKQNPLCPTDLANNTMAAIFNRAGYETMRTCKRGNSYQAANKQFTTVHDRTNRQADPKHGSPWHAERVLDYLQGRDPQLERAIAIIQAELLKRPPSPNFDDTPRYTKPRQRRQGGGAVAP